MPRVNPVAANEIEIGQRLREARDRKLLTQTNLAIRIQIGRERLASYESGRVPLPARIGASACEILGINALWLACGTEPKWGQAWIEIPDQKEFKQLTFAEAFTRIALINPSSTLSVQKMGLRAARKASIGYGSLGPTVVAPNTSVEDQDDFFSQDVVRVPFPRPELDAKLRNAALKTKGLRCECCGITFREALGADEHKMLQIHLLKSPSETSSSGLTLDNILVLCPLCHELAHVIHQPTTLEQLKVARARIHLPTSDGSGG